MFRTSLQLRDDALAIWRAGLAAVDSTRLVRDVVRVEGDQLIVGDDEFRLPSWRRIVVVGAGKAGAGMADGLEQSLGDRVLAEKQVSGWLNVPADCVRPLRRIHLHAARPAGINEPTSAGVTGTEHILKLVSGLSENDLCICLLSGGGSALLPAPVMAISLEDKQAITKHLSSAGANIEELNCVRKQLSRIKGGGLARACRGGNLITLIISDVLGDPLDVIASGPTVPNLSSPRDALRVLEKFPSSTPSFSHVVEYLKSLNDASHRVAAPSCSVTNLVIGNNAVAVDAAGIEAERRGYSHAMISAQQLEGTAESVGQHHVDIAWEMLRAPGPDCLITGGEPTVQLVARELRGKGGRNQQLVLAALQRLVERSQSAQDSENTAEIWSRLALLSGGTDGEDGPTDAAGAILDESVYQAMCRKGLSPEEALRRNDAYHFFEPLGGLIKTGPTHTNVCDVRVIVTTNRP